MEQNNKHQQILDKLDSFFENATEEELNELYDKVNELTEKETKPAMAQTAVQWFINAAFDAGFLWITDKPEMIELNYIIEQAKEMEKQQMIEARVTAPFLPTPDKEVYLEEAEEYYNERYGKK
jgi:hypothetical protein